MARLAVAFSAGSVNVRRNPQKRQRDRRKRAVAGGGNRYVFFGAFAFQLINDVKAISVECESESLVNDLKRIHAFDVLVLSEPRISVSKALDVVKTLGFSGSFIVDAVGFSGGFWIPWNPDVVDLCIVDHTNQSISALVSSTSHRKSIVTAICASPAYYAVREDLWHHLDDFHAHCEYPWMLAGYEIN
jgi:hypothetical protein